MLGHWLRTLRRESPPIEPGQWNDAVRRLPWVRGIDPDRQLRLQALGTHFLSEKTITPLAGLQLEDQDRMVLAALCCLPLLEFGKEGMSGWSQLLVYPDTFRAHRSHTDAAGVVHEWDDELIGEAWQHGPLVLSWADILADIAEPDAGFCVTVHEMAHKLDALDGVLDGTPALPRAWQQEWARDFQHCYDRFCEDVQRGIDTGLDPYAADSPEEFFAVASEYHFSASPSLEARMPEVALHLRRFYGPPPRLTVAIQP